MKHLVDPTPADLHPLVDEAVARFEAEIPDEGPFDDVVGFRVQWTDSLRGSNVVSLRCAPAGGRSADLIRRYVNLDIDPDNGARVGLAVASDSRASMLESLRDVEMPQLLIDNVIQRTSVGQPRRVDRLVTEPPGQRPFEVSLESHIVAAAGSFDPSRPRPPHAAVSDEAPLAWIDWSYRADDTRGGGRDSAGTLICEAESYVVDEDDHTGWRLTLGPEPSLIVRKEDYDATTSWRGRALASEAAAVLVNPALFAVLIAQAREWVVDSPHRGRYRAVEKIPDGGIGRGGW